MHRRGFLKLTLAITGSILMPRYIYADSINLSTINFSVDIFNENRQTIIVFLNGGPSSLSGNLSNIDEVNASSQEDYFSNMGENLDKIAEYDLWGKAGGEEMKNMLDNNEMTIIRTCYSAQRESVGNKAHGICTAQNMRGHFEEDRPGILTNISRVMEYHGKFDEMQLPFMTLAGENDFYAGDPVNGLKPVSLDYRLSNPFDRTMTSSIFYTVAERDARPDDAYKEIDSVLDGIFDTQAKSQNSVEVMNSFLDNRKILESKISDVSTARIDGDVADKNLLTYGYASEDSFHQTLATAIELLESNTSTRSITIGTGGLGGWDDHSYCVYNYTRRMKNLFTALEAGMRHLDGLGKKGKISIIVYGEFGRNVNLNASLGWDHGNLQNLFVLGGTDYFNHVGGTDAIVGETIVDNGGTPKSGRVWLKPKEGSYWCEPLCIAATLYAIHGIENPEVLTNGYGIINPQVKGEDFFTP